MFSKYKKKILLSAVIGAVIFLAFSIYADFDNLMQAFASFNWWYFPVILALSFMNYIVRFFKWEYYRKILNIEIKPKVSFLIFLSAFVMSVTPGKMGEVLKSFLLKEENGTPVERSAPIVLAERLTDFLSVVLLCIAGAFVFDYGKTALAVIGVTFIGFALLLSSRKISLYFIGLLEKVKPLSKIIHKFHTAYESIYQLVKIKPLVYATLISVIGWFFECIGFYLVLRVFSSTTNIEVSLLTATFIYGFATLIGAVAMLPGGLGVTEASLTGLLEILKIPKGVSVASTIIIRVATLWFAVVVGIVAVYFYQRYTNKKIM
jgi:uncharacterized protein (TIRG00374 family)